jgi:hypothetical protein
MDFFPRPARLAVTLALGALCLTSLSGCNLIAAAAQFAPEPDVGAAYTNLKGQTVGVLVWVDRGPKIDYPMLQADVAKSLTNKLTELTQPPEKKGKPTPELAGIQYLNPMTVIRFQDDHPELEGLPPTDVATRLGVTRVIYIEIKDCRTHAPDSPDLFKGLISASVEVLEVTAGPNKVAKVGYSNPSMEIEYPSDHPEGLAIGDTSAQTIYDKTVDEFTTQVALLFFRHPSK